MTAPEPEHDAGADELDELDELLGPEGDREVFERLDLNGSDDWESTP